MKINLNPSPDCPSRHDKSRRATFFSIPKFKEPQSSETRLKIKDGDPKKEAKMFGSRERQNDNNDFEEQPV